jgi:hypothetical protein
LRIVTAPNELTANISKTSTKPLVNKNINDHDQNGIFDKNEIDSGSSDEDHEAKSITPVNPINGVTRSII